MPTELNRLARKACLDAGYDSPSPEQMGLAVVAVRAGLEAGAKVATNYDPKGLAYINTDAVCNGIAAAIRAIGGGT